MSNIVVHTFYYTHTQFETMVKSLEIAGISGIELYANAPHLCEIYCYTPQERKELLTNRKELLEQHGVRVAAVYAPTMDTPTNIADENREVRSFSLDTMKRLIEDARILGAGGVVLDSGWGLYDKSLTAAWDRSVKSLRELAAFAIEQGIDLYLRPIGTATNLVKNQQGLSRMLNEVDCPAMKVCADLSVMGSYGETVEDYLEQFGSKLGHVRIGNYSAEGELCKGMGLARLLQLCETLRKAGYAGSTAIEIAWEQLDHPHEASVELAKHLAQLLT